MKTIKLSKEEVFDIAEEEATMVKQLVAKYGYIESYVFERDGSHFMFDVEVNDGWEVDEDGLIAYEVRPVEKTVVEWVKVNNSTNAFNTMTEMGELLAETEVKGIEPTTTEDFSKLMNRFAGGSGAIYTAPKGNNMNHCTCYTSCLCGTYDIETFYQKELKMAGPYADFVEAKETWWEYNELLRAEAAEDVDAPEGADLTGWQI